MDTTSYLTSFEHFLNKMQSFDNTFTPDISDALSDVCRLLRVGALKTEFQSKIYGDHIDPQGVFCFYKDENCNADGSCLEYSYDTVSDGTAVYIFFPLCGGGEWTEEEKKRIKIIADILFIFNGRTRLLEVSRRLAFYDPEFNVYNTRYFIKHLASLINNGKIYDYCAVNYNLKQLNIINSRIGRKACTQVMIRFTELIRELLSGDEAICRLGGDNFAAVIRKENFPSVARLLKGTVIKDAGICSEGVRISASAGLYNIVRTSHQVTSNEIMDRIHIAMQRAKRSAKPAIVEFDQELFELQQRSSDIAAAFDDALLNDEFKIYYQPKVSLDDYSISGAEALCRWMHNDKIIYPGSFIPVLEQCNDICRLDFYILEKVCIDIRSWIDHKIPPVRISVNLSRKHLKNKDMVSRIVSIVDKYSIPHDLIELELTETITEIEFQQLQKNISSLRQNGFATSVDDFGTGYSSLNLIKKIPWNVLKLDRSLLPAKGSENVWQDRILFKYIVAMAKEMGLECVAEGVETAEQLKVLSENNCEMAQGFFFDMPMCIKDFEEKLKDRIYTV